WFSTVYERIRPVDGSGWRPAGCVRIARSRPLPNRPSRRPLNDGPHSHGIGGVAAMIIGIGSDLIDIRRIEKTLDRFGERFLNRVFTDVERAKSGRRAERAASYAKRFAAKEACSKALGTGIRMGIAWREMGVVNLPSGKPTIVLTGGAAERLERLLPRGFEARIDLTITDDFPLAHAFVVSCAWPQAWPQPPTDP